jgi:hypothetical protein
MSKTIEDIAEDVREYVATPDPDLELDTPASPLPEAADERKKYPMYRGLFLYFPRALAAVSRVSWEGSKQHHPDKPIHWDRSKSPDDLDAMLRHLAEGDLVKVAWRALAALEKQEETK